MSAYATIEVMATRRWKRKKIVVVCLVLVCLMGVGIGFLVLKSQNQAKHLPPKVKSEISGFQPYYFSGNAPLPNGLKIDPGKTKYENGTLFVTVKSSDGKSATISEQPVPEEFAAKGGSLVGAGSTDTSLGKLTFSFSEGRTAGFLITKDRKTFIIFDSAQSFSQDDVRVIISSLTKVN